MLWAFGPVSSKPSGEAADSTFDQHDGHDTFSLTLSGSSSSSGSSNSSDSGSGGGNDSSAVVLPWLNYQKLIVAHAALSSIGFLVLLPLGGLLARWARTFVPGTVWFNGHWIINFGLGTCYPIICVILSHHVHSWARNHCRFRTCICRCPEGWWWSLVYPYCMSLSRQLSFAGC